MTKFKDSLIKQLEQLPDVTLDFWKDTELLGVNYKGKEVAHFQTDPKNEIDIRLTPKIIKEEKLVVPENAVSHPDRSKNSRWIIQFIDSKEDVKKVFRLIGIAISIRS